MRLTVALAILLGAAAGVGGRLALRVSADTPGSESAPGASPALARVAANGVVEGASPEAGLRPEAAGPLAVLNVRENAWVSRGTVLAEVANDTQKCRVDLARAELAEARKQLEKLKNGEREERRRAAEAAEAAKKILHEEAKAELERTKRSGIGASRQQLDAAAFRVQQTRAEWEMAKAEKELVLAPPRAEDVALAEAQVSAAEAKLRLAEAELARTRIVAPTDGLVLQVFAERGEMAGPTSAQPVLVLADVSRRRVRAFVEELDVDRVRVGQEASITADGLPGRTFTAKVATVFPRMGKRAPESDMPGEFKDVYFREVMLDLNGGEELPLHLRVHVRINVGNEP